MSNFEDKEQKRSTRRSAVRTVVQSIDENEEKNIENEPIKKRKGRPKLKNRELRKRYSFTILPSIYDKAQEKAMNEGKTLSELVADFLTDYIK